MNLPPSIVTVGVSVTTIFVQVITVHIKHVFALEYKGKFESINQLYFKKQELQVMQLCVVNKIFKGIPI